MADRLTDRLRDVRRDFPDALDLGAGAGALSALLRDRGGVSRVVALDISHEWGRCHQARPNDDLVVTGDEELLPFAEASFDLVVSSLALHWVNDLPGTLAQIRRALRPDGFFLASFWGGETLHELRAAWMAAEIEMEGGAGPRVSPLVETADAGALMQRAGFALPVVDADRITVTYEDAFALMA
ncbi:MAG: methyltransferase domain-containing protein, partial [Alphaproteobacteria bacterium]